MAWHVMVTARLRLLESVSVAFTPTDMKAWRVRIPVSTLGDEEVVTLYVFVVLRVWFDGSCVLRFEISSPWIYLLESYRAAALINDAKELRNRRVGFEFWHLSGRPEPRRYRHGESPLFINSKDHRASYCSVRNPKCSASSELFLSLCHTREGWKFVRTS